MTWTVMLFALLGVGIGSVVTRRRTERRSLDLQRRLLASLQGLSADSLGDVEVAVVDHAPVGTLDCGIDVVNGAGRVIGTALISTPQPN
jgi:hypothetical protein